MMATPLPTFTDTVNQQFFIEAQGGSQNPINLLDRFPSSIYTKSIDSNLVKFLYALLGPVGVGLLRQEYLEARLMFEDANLSIFDLDALYTNPFAFARLAEETYDFDASAALLSTRDRARILTSDASFRNRAIDYFKGIRAGGTLQGLSLVAKSGLNRPVELIENYRALYDQYADIPLGLAYMGNTVDANEVVVLPRQNIPQNAQQTLTITGDPNKGWFTLTLPLGPDYNIIQVMITTGSSIVTVPDASLVTPGTYLTGPVPTPGTFAMVGAPQSTTTVQLLHPPTASDPTLVGQPYPMASTATLSSYAGRAETVPLPFNASALVVQNALQALPVVGPSNVSVTGGPLPNSPLTIVFRNAMGDQPVPPLLPNLSPNPITGIGSVGSAVPEMSDVTNDPFTIDATVTIDTAGTSADSQTSALRPADEHAMQIGLDMVRPQTAFFTTQPASNVTQRQPIRKAFAGSSYTEVLRYEIGNSKVSWPVDPLHWIQVGVEREAPRPVGDLQHHYQGFHNISDITAYTEAALSDPAYLDGTDLTPYWDTMIGRYSLAQIALYPFLAAYQDTSVPLNARQALADSPDPLIITQTVNGVGMINDIYPSDYMGLSGTLAPATQNFWSSLERAPAANGTPTVDYLEIDLGHVQPVNYLYFEATRKPYLIFVDYDVLDQSPRRMFIPINLASDIGQQSTMGLSYNASATNPWTTGEIHCTNALNQMIYTRFLRLGFARNPSGSPFAPIGLPLIPYSIELRNLRIGRNIL